MRNMSSCRSKSKHLRSGRIILLTIQTYFWIANISLKTFSNRNIEKSFQLPFLMIENPILNDASFDNHFVVKRFPLNNFCCVRANDWAPIKRLRLWHDFVTTYVLSPYFCSLCLLVFLFLFNVDNCKGRCWFWDLPAQKAKQERSTLATARST